MRRHLGLGELPRQAGQVARRGHPDPGVTAAARRRGVADRVREDHDRLGAADGRIVRADDQPAVAGHVHRETPVVGAGPQVEQVARVRRIQDRRRCRRRPRSRHGSRGCRWTSSTPVVRRACASRNSRRSAGPRRSMTRRILDDLDERAAGRRERRSSASSASARASVTVSRPSAARREVASQRVRPHDRLLDRAIRARRGEPPRVHEDRGRQWVLRGRPRGLPSRTSIPRGLLASAADRVAVAEAAVGDRLEAGPLLRFDRDGSARRRVVVGAVGSGGRQRPARAWRTPRRAGARHLVSRRRGRIRVPLTRRLHLASGHSTGRRYPVGR